MSKMELEDRGRALEEVFFQKEQARLLEAMHSKKRRDEVIEALSDATGLDDRGTLGHLADLGIRAGSLAAFALVPLVHVAWANGSVDAKERDAILSAAADAGIREGTPPHDFLTELLSAMPAGALMDSWEAFVRVLRDGVGDEAFRTLAGDVAGRARGVAEAAGGLLGIGSISQAEGEALARIEAALS